MIRYSGRHKNDHHLILALKTYEFFINFFFCSCLLMCVCAKRANDTYVEDSRQR